MPLQGGQIHHKGHAEISNPVTKKTEPKSMYCEKLDDAVLCGGVYK